MGIRGLQYQTINVPLAAGLSQKTDDRALQPPGLVVDAALGVEPVRDY